MLLLIQLPTKVAPHGRRGWSSWLRPGPTLAIEDQSLFAIQNLCAFQMEETESKLSQNVTFFLSVSKEMEC